MKKLMISLCALTFVAQSYALSVKELAVEMKKHQKQCKAEWFDFAKSSFDKKMDLIKSHHAQEADLKIASLQQMPETTDKNEIDSFWLGQLGKCLDLKEQQLNDWRNFQMEQASQAKRLMDKDTQELNKFKEKLESLSSNGSSRSVTTREVTTSTYETSQEPDSIEVEA